MLCSFKGVFRRILAVRGCGIRHRSGQTAFGRPIDRTRPGRRRGEKEKSSKNARSGAVSRPGASVDRQSNAVKRTFPATIARFSPFVQKMFHVKHFAFVLSERRVEYARNGRFSLLFVSRETFFVFVRKRGQPRERPPLWAKISAPALFSAWKRVFRFRIFFFFRAGGIVVVEKFRPGRCYGGASRARMGERSVWDSKKRPGEAKKNMQKPGRIAKNG